MLLVILTLVAVGVGISSANHQATCGDAPLIERAEVPSNYKGDHPIGSTIEYQCEYGFIPSDYRRIVECVYFNVTDTAEWTEPSFTCTPRSCGDPGFVSHARRNGSVFTFPSRINYVCDAGYKLDGVAERYCQTNGQWSGSLPSCESVKCKVPDHPANGVVQFESLEYGSELHYACNKGFALKKSEQRTCSQDGSWSGKEPQCEESFCDHPSAPLHGSMELVGKAGVGSITIYSCDRGYVLFGASTSKCLSTGDWTFPTPACLESCKIVAVDNGRIGLYKKSGRRQYFQEVSIGTEIENGRELYLKCDNKKYEPAGGTASEIKISCSNGQWSTQPSCKPVACRSDPPLVPNARLLTTERSHGTKLTYGCNQYFTKAAYGSTECKFGVWEGRLPVCADTRCSRNDLNFAGLQSGGREKYLNNEIFKPKCADGYEIAKPGKSELVCNNGQWKGNLPPCKPAKCLQGPPAPLNGRITYLAMEHGSSATVVCNEDFQLQTSVGSVQCLFGQWSMPKEVCKDTRCYLKTLPLNHGIDISDPSPTRSGNYGNIACLEGYERKHGKPFCDNGIWRQQNNASPCQPSSCVVTELSNGEFRYLEIRYKLNWKFQREELREFKKEAFGRIYNHNSNIFVGCANSYFFHGLNNPYPAVVTCWEGKWTPRPLCLKFGSSMPVESTTQGWQLRSSTSVSHTTKPIVSVSPTSEELTTEAHRVTESSFDEYVAGIESTTEQKVSAKDVPDDVKVQQEQNCSCLYDLNDETIFAFSGWEEVSFGSSIKEGSTVQLSCRVVGHQRLEGASVLKCENCAWQPSEFPFCVSPSKGDAVVTVHSKDNSALTDNSRGVILVPSGISFNISCTVMDSEWPVFLNLAEGLKIYEVYSPHGAGYDFQVDIVIDNVTDRHSGKYECQPNKGHSNFVTISVQGTRCPHYSGNTAVTVKYNDERKPGSKARFQCSDANKILHGDFELTCLSTGLWSAEYPTCRDIRCSGHRTVANLVVNYTNGRFVNSRAEFRCQEPYVLKGPKSLTCHFDGKWSNGSPSCEYVICTMDSLMKALPDGVVPGMEGVNSAELPYGSVLPLQCLQEAHLIIGVREVTCSETGGWKIGDVTCTSGCGAVETMEKSNLIVDPNKNLYRFGESVSFSCPPGLKLNSDLVRMMCLQYGWSEKNVPFCE